MKWINNKTVQGETDDIKKYGIPTYEEQIRLLIGFLQTDIDIELKINMVKSFVKKFGVKK